MPTHCGMDADPTDDTPPLSFLCPLLFAAAAASVLPADGLLCVDPGAAAAILLFLQMLALCVFKVCVSHTIVALVKGSRGASAT